MNLHGQPRIVVALAWLCLVLAILHCACRRPEPEKPAPRVVIERRACIAQPPPQPASIDPEGPSEGCPVEFVACLRRQHLVDLVRYLLEIQRWSRAVYAACGPAAPTPIPGDTIP